ncbi:MAG TPA: hypothetical protein VGB18_04315, partial [Candidatus Thermoplasmatota archaeon]
LVDVGALAQRLFKAEAKKLERFAQDRCVANTAGSGEKHFNYLFKVTTGRYRVFKQGDAIEYSHAMAATTPEVHRVPADYKPLFSAAARFPAGLRPAEASVAPTATVVVPAKPAAKQVGKKVEVPVPPPAPPPAAMPAINRGLRADLSSLDEHMPSNVTKRTIHDMLFLEIGKLGSQLDAQDKQSFTIQVGGVAGMLRTRENLLVKLPRGIAIAHQADLVLELENPARTLYIDIVEAAHNAEDLKAHAFDTMHLRNEGKARYSILVFLRTPNGTLQEQAEAIGSGYDFFFGVDASHVKDANKFYALKSQILQWLHGKVKPGVA